MKAEDYPNYQELVRKRVKEDYWITVDGSIVDVKKKDKNIMLGGEELKKLMEENFKKIQDEKNL